jgi:predicted ester cyclase
MGRPPTGRSFEVNSLGIFRFDDGRISEHWGVFDQMGMLAQLGAFPTGDESKALLIRKKVF